MAKLTLIPQKTTELTNKTKKKEKRERNEAHAIKWNKWCRANMYHEKTPFIAFICNKKRVHEIQTVNNVAENFDFTCRI